MFHAGCTSWFRDYTTTRLIYLLVAPSVTIISSELWLFYSVTKKIYNQPDDTVGIFSIYIVLM